MQSKPRFFSKAAREWLEAAAAALCLAALTALLCRAGLGIGSKP